MNEYIFIGVGAICGVVAHILKKVIMRRESDKTFSLRNYLTQNPYKTVMTLFYAGAGVAGLVVAGEASFYTALLAGFSANSLSGASD